MIRRHHLGLAVLLSLLAILLSASVGCSSTPEPMKTEGVTSFEGAAVRMPDPGTVYGMWFFSGNSEAIEFATAQAALQARRQAIATVRGVRYSYLMIAGDDGPSIRVEDLSQAEGVSDTVVRRQDWLTMRGETRHYQVAELALPVVSQMSAAARADFGNGQGFKGTIELPVEAFGRPLTAHWVAIDQALRYKFGRNPGSYRGRIFVVKCEPRLNRPSTNDTNAWEAGRSSSEAGDDKIVYDVEVVLSQTDGPMPRIPLRELSRLLTPPQPPIEVRQAELEAENEENEE